MRISKSQKNYWLFDLNHCVPEPKKYRGLQYKIMAKYTESVVMNNRIIRKIRTQQNEYEWIQLTNKTKYFSEGYNLGMKSTAV